MMCPRQMSVLVLVSALVGAAVGDGVLMLRPLSTVYLPTDYDQVSGEPVYELADGAAEQGAYDPLDRVVYTVGDRYLYVIDYSDAATPSIVHRVRLDSKGNDVELCGDTVAVAVDGQPGVVQLYRRFDRGSSEMLMVAEIQVGYTPDMLIFTRDCLTILVANEGELFEESGYLTDPEGSVSIIRLSGEGTGDGGATVTSLNFTSFNSRADEYVSRGVRWPYRGELGLGPNTFSQSLEPEYITINYDDTKAWVCLQESNAVAVIDIASESVVDIYPLGYKSWGDVFLDPSDRDGGIKLGAYDVLSAYQPDAIKYMEIEGVGYIATANEGADMDFTVGGREWDETLRGKDFVKNDLLSDTFPESLKAALMDDEKLGRLKFSTVDGRNSITNDTERLYHYGGRSFSVFAADDLSLVYDSGGALETTHSLFYPDLFNSDSIDDDFSRTPKDTFDTRSDNKGPETESLEVGEVDGKLVLFVGNEKTSTLMVYTFTENRTTPDFESILRSGGTDRSYTELLNDRNLGDLAPEDIRFIKAADSSTGKPMILVIGTASGTAAMYEVVDSLEPTGDGGGSCCLKAPGTMTMAATLGVLYLLRRYFL